MMLQLRLLFWQRVAEIGAGLIIRATRAHNAAGEMLPVEVRPNPEFEEYIAARERSIRAGARQASKRFRL